MTEKAIFAAGCFWGVEKLIKEHSGIISTKVGYTGGVSLDPTYEDICTGKTGHYEAIEIIFDSSITNFKSLLKLFFKLHDPTQTNGQHGDIGPQYKSAIFYTTQVQKNQAEKLIKEIDQRNIFENKIATSVLEAQKFYPAEDYHQNYLEKKPHGYMCHFINHQLDLDFD